jgi:hypothetical protein
LRLGPSAVLHAIVDRVVDDYVPVLQGVEDDIEEVRNRFFPSIGPTRLNGFTTLSARYSNFGAPRHPFSPPSCSSRRSHYRTCARKSVPIFVTCTTTCCASTSRSTPFGTS